MAVIVEVLGADDRRVVSRVRAVALPFTIGRGWDNDLILDDAYVDARHARIRVDDDGRLVIEDLGSVNGLLVGGTGERQPSAAARGGAEVRIGRTTLRFRDPDEPVPPALTDVPVRRSAGPVGVHLASRPMRLLLPVLTGFTAGVLAWLGSYERSSSDTVLGVVFAYAGVAAIWAGIWAIAARVVVGRFNFTGHFAVVSAVLLAGTAVFNLSEWAGYIVPDVPADGAFGFALLGLLAAAVAAHLGLASHLSVRRRWRAGIITAAVLLAVSGTAVLFDDEEFSDVPEFSGILKPFVPHWPAPVSVDAFMDAAAAARTDVDELAGRD